MNVDSRLVCALFRYNFVSSLKADSLEANAG